MPPVTIITAIPTFISPEEHRERTSETPASFADIPPVLRHKEEHASAVFEPLVEDLTEDELKRGTLYILESVLAFISASSGRGFQIEYPSIILHAISRADSGPCIYCQLGDPSSREEQAPEDEEQTIELRELKIKPESAASLDEMFEAFSACASLHPDPMSDSDDDMGIDADDDVIVDADIEAVQAIAAEGVEGETELTEAGRATLERLESLIEDPRSQLNGASAVNGHHVIVTGGSGDEEHRFSDAEPHS